MKTYTLTNENWYRGQGSDESYIVPPDGTGPRCCLGNVYQQEGIETEGGQKEVALCHQLPDELRALAVRGDNFIPSSSEIFDVYRLNDAVGSSDHERVAAINKITEPYGFRFEFREDEKD